jgi:hypothetical protein
MQRAIGSLSGISKYLQEQRMKASRKIVQGQLNWNRSFNNSNVRSTIAPNKKANSVIEQDGPTPIFLLSTQ